MAIHDSVLLGAMSQSVDNLTMCVCRKLRIVRHKPKHVTNPRTDKQRTQRAKMKAVIEVARAFAPVAKIGFPAQPAGQTGYNGFVSANLQAVTVDEKFEGIVDYTQLVCSGDMKLRTPKVTVTIAGKVVSFTQESQDASSHANLDDQVYAVLYEKALDEVELVKLRERGESGSTSFTLPEEWTAAEVMVYSFATTVAGRKTSKTLVLTVESGE